MPLIEELPVTQSHRTSHGWAYIPDTGAPIAAVQPGTRKRDRHGATSTTTNTHPTTSSSLTATAKHQRAIDKRLADLEKENHKDIPIPVPARKDRGVGKKMTPNVRRILTYQRTFAHYLADEEALLNGAQTVPLPPPLPVKGEGAPAVVSRVEEGRGGRGKRESTTTAKGGSTPVRASPSTAATGSTSRRRSGLQKQESTTTIKAEPSATTSSMPPPPVPRTPTQSRSSQAQLDQTNTTAITTNTDPPSSQPPPDPLLPPHLSHLQPLLVLKDLPPQPSDRLMQALLSEPPLSYTAARARPLSQPVSKLPVQHFCTICGHWGVTRCKDCAERMCSARECYDLHRENVHFM